MRGIFIGTIPALRWRLPQSVRESRMADTIEDIQRRRIAYSPIDRRPEP